MEATFKLCVYGTDSDLWNYVMKNIRTHSEPQKDVERGGGWEGGRTLS